MDNIKLLTVIVASYNSEKYIKDTLCSILNQSYQKIELIISDDASPNFNRAELEEFVNINKKSNLIKYIIYKNPENLGTVKNLNNALRNANGEYICMIGADDVYYSNEVIEKLVNSLEEYRELFLVTGKTLSCSENLKLIKSTRVELSNLMQEEITKLNKNERIACVIKHNLIFLATQSCCFKKEFFSKYGLYDERYVLMEDLPMMLRILNKQINFKCINNYIVLHREKTGISSTLKIISMNSNRYYKDMHNFFLNELVGYKDVIGKLYLDNNISLYEFRCKYVKYNIDNNTQLSKLVLILKYFDIIFLYMVFKFKNTILNKILLWKIKWQKY